MTYNPYPQQDPSSGYQQPYQPYPTQQPYQPYPAQQPYPAYAQAPPPSGSGGKVMLIVVVVIIVIIAVTIIMAGILVVYMQSFSSGPGNTVPTASLITVPFTNTYEGSGTTNGGGWAVKVANLAGTKPALSEITVGIELNSIAVAKLSGVSTTTASVSYTAGTMKWYLKSASGALKFMDGSTAKTLDASSAKNVGVGEFETVQGAYFIYNDVDGDGLMSVGDIVYVYTDSNGDGTPNISGSGYKLDISMTGLTIAMSTLV